MNKYNDISFLLTTLTKELQREGFWEELAPTPEQLASQEPFCCDTLTFAQWLQWVFIPRIETMIRERIPLPTRCEIMPMGEESWRGRVPEPKALLALLSRIDILLSTPEQRPH